MTVERRETAIPPMSGLSRLDLIVKLCALTTRVEALERQQQTTSITVRLIQDVADERFDRLEQARAASSSSPPRLETEQWREVRS